MFWWPFAYLQECNRDAVSIVVLLMTLVLTGLYQYMPHHMAVMQRRATYYLFGQDSEGAERSLWQWVGGYPRQEL